MKFVTVMDMWLLIVNIGLLACLIYVVKNMVKVIMEVQAFKNVELIDKELKSVIGIIKEERDTNNQIDDLGFYDDLIDRLERRRTSNLLESNKVK